MTIKARILLPMIILTIIASSAVLISNIVQFTTYVESNIDNLLSAASETAINKINIYESYACTTSVFIAECPTVIESLKTGDRDLLISHISLHNEAAIDFCTITDKYGIVLGRTHNPQAYGDDVSHTPSVRKALSGRITSGIESRPIVRLSICSGVPVYDDEGDLIGTVITGFRLDTNDFVDSLASVFNCVATISLGEERMSTTLLNEDGTRAVGTKTPEAAVEKVLAGEIYTGRIPVMGNDAIVRYVPIRDSGDSVIGMLFVGYFLEIQSKTIWHFVQLGFLFTVLLLAFSVPIIIFISNRIAAPVNEAVSVLGEISEGNFNARIEGNHKGDLAVLQNSVNNTAIKLSIYLKEKIQEDKIRELAAIVSTSDAGIVVNGLDGAVRQWNVGAENILGYSQGEIIGRTPHSYTPGRYHADIDRIISRIQKGEHIAHLETVRKHKDGRFINCSASYTPILDGSGSVTGMVSIFHDITNEKFAEEKARNLAAIVAIADAGIIVKDKSGIITEWNIGAENILGFRPEEMIGRTVHCYVPEEFHSSIEHIDAKLAAGEHIVHVETIRKHKDGHIVNCSASYTPIFGKEKDFAGAVAIFHDITANKLAEKKARNLAAIAAIADAGIIVKDENGVVLEWNIGAENILGYKPCEMIGNSTHLYAPAESHEKIDEITRRLAGGEHIVHMEVVRKHKDGRLVDCSASYTPIFDENKIFTGSVAVFHDISDKKQIEIKLQEALTETEKKHNTIMASMEYAKKIQTSLLPQDFAFKKAFSDYSIIWNPRDTVGGDIYWINNFSEGTVLCACDCTGHGTPGALLTMLVVSAFEGAINENNCGDTAQIVWELEQRLVSVFNVNSDGCIKSKLSEVKDGCDLAVLYIANDGSVTISSGNLHVFICDGEKVTKIKGQRIFVGEGGLRGKDDVRVVRIPADPDNKFYIASDGLYDQIGGERERPFGYQTFKRIILENHNKSQQDISDMIWDAFESYRGGQPRRDDVGLLTFKPRGYL